MRPPPPYEYVLLTRGCVRVSDMVRRRALSDDSNLADVRMLCERYPNMRLVLCHSARGFNMHHTIDVIDQLKDLDNLYFDTGDCSAAALAAPADNG